MGDTVVESDETFTVTLSTPVNATLGTATGTGTITNDDVVVPTVSIGPATVVEGHSGTTNAEFPVTLSAATTVPVTVSYATGDGTATAGSDYTATSGTLTIPAGQTTGTITVAVVGDTVMESDETFTVTLSTPVNATLGTATGTGTITNDDVVVPTVSIGPATVVEGHSGTTNAEFPVTLSAATTVLVTVSYATGDGTATAGSDYTARAGRSRFRRGRPRARLRWRWWATRWWSRTRRSR